jgi:hypothetical protein
MRRFTLTVGEGRVKRQLRFHCRRWGDRWLILQGRHRWLLNGVDEVQLSTVLAMLEGRADECPQDGATESALHQFAEQLSTMLGKAGRQWQGDANEPTGGTDGYSDLFTEPPYCIRRLELLVRREISFDVASCLEEIVPYLSFRPVICIYVWHEQYGLELVRRLDRWLAGQRPIISGSLFVLLAGGSRSLHQRLAGLDSPALVVTGGSSPGRAAPVPTRALNPIVIHADPFPGSSSLVAGGLPVILDPELGDRQQLEEAMTVYTSLDLQQVPVFSLANCMIGLTASPAICRGGTSSFCLDEDGRVLRCVPSALARGPVLADKPGQLVELTRTATAPEVGCPALEGRNQEQREVLRSLRDYLWNQPE